MMNSLNAGSEEKEPAFLLQLIRAGEYCRKKRAASGAPVLFILERKGLFSGEWVFQAIEDGLETVLIAHGFRALISCFILLILRALAGSNAKIENGLFVFAEFEHYGAKQIIPFCTAGRDAQESLTGG